MINTSSSTTTLQTNDNNNNQKRPSHKTLESLFALDSKKQPNSGDDVDEILSSNISYCTFSASERRALKHEKLVEILSALKPPKKTSLSEQVISALMNMVAANLFRPLPPPRSKPSSDFDFLSPPPPPGLMINIPGDIIIQEQFLSQQDQTTTSFSSWNSLQIVYEVLMRVVLSADAKLLGSHVDERFLSSLLALFNSDDPRERESLKNVYHRIYLRLTPRRAFMRKSMSDALLSHAYSDAAAAESHGGVGEMLEIWGSVISGVAVPVREEHKLFLMRVLVPLHRGGGAAAYHRQLAYCVTQMVQKEAALGGVVVRGVLRYWPITNCQKEVLLIGELEELLEIVDSDHYRKLALPLSTRITRCLNSWNSQVAERALYVWNNEYFVKMVSMEIEEVYPIVVQGIEKNLKWHWSKTIRQLTQNVKSMLQEMDPMLYSKCLHEIDRRESAANQAEINRKEKWDRIEMQANKNYTLLQQNSNYVH